MKSLNYPSLYSKLPCNTRTNFRTTSFLTTLSANAQLHYLNTQSSQTLNLSLKTAASILLPLHFCITNHHRIPPSPVSIDRERERVSGRVSSSFIRELQSVSCSDSAAVRKSEEGKEKLCVSPTHSALPFLPAAIKFPAATTTSSTVCHSQANQHPSRTRAVSEEKKKFSVPLCVS